MIFGLTGKKGSGKTWVCEQLVQTLPDDSVFGFYSPAVFEGDEKTGIDVVLCPQDARLPFAKLAYAGCTLPIGRWCMQPETFEAVNQHLKSKHAAKVFLADEIGPYELEEGKGWTPALDLANSSEFPVVVLTFRPGLRAQMQEKFPGMIVCNVDTRQAQAAALEDILAAIPY